MKGYFYLIAAIAGLFMAASCQKENFEVAEGYYADVSFTTELPSGVGTKAIADGQTVNTLYYEVYASNADGTVDTDATVVTEGSVTVTAGTASVNVRLVKNKPYTVFFWAQYEGTGYTSPYTVTDLRKISVSYTNAVANDEKRDAFYFVAKGVKYSGATTTPVTLTRPFAQVNVGTNDRVEFERDGVTLNGATSTITVTNVANTFEPFTNRATATGTTELTASFSTAAAIPTEDLTVVVNNSNNTYDYLAMAYVLVPNATGETSSTSVSTISSGITLSGISDPISISYEGATVQQNRRTNLVGKLLTTTSSYDIVIDNNFVKPDNTYEYENVATTAEANVAFAEGKTSIKIEAIEETVATLTLPETIETTSVVLPETDAVVTFEYPTDATETPDVLNITAPATEGTDIVLPNIVLNVPETTVYVNGVLQTVTASTAQNTLIVEEGSVIKDLIIVKGNVRIEKGGKVEKITRSEDNTDSETKVYLGEGVDKPTVDPADTKLVLVPFTTPEEGKSLAEQIAATTYGKVTLTEDVVLDAPLTIAAGQEITLDLNGYTLSYTSTVAATSYMIENKNKANLTIKNGTLVFAATTPDTGWGGEGQPDFPGYANNTIKNLGVLTIENATLENKTKRGGASYVIDNYAGSKLTVNEGSHIIQSGKDIAIRMFNGNAGAIDVTINGGTITGHRAVWVQLAGSASTVAPIMNLTVNGGTLTSVDPEYNLAVYSYNYGNDTKNVTVNIYGGTFNGDIALTGGSNKTNIETLNIYGGTFNGAYGDVYSYGEDVAAKEKITIKGGTFSSFDILKYMGNSESATIKITEDDETTDSITIPAGANVTLDLNGKTLTGTDTTDKNFGLIQNNGTLTVKNGTLKLTATHNNGWSRYSAVISNNPGGNLTIEDDTYIEHLGGTDMAYGIDILTNGGIGDVFATINGGTIKSTYRAIRQFLNSDSKQNSLTINGGEIYGVNKGIFFHDPSTKANNGKLVISDKGRVNSVYLFVTEKSTEWPVEVSIAEAAITEPEGVTSKNVPEGYEVINTNGTWTVKTTK